MAEPNKDRSQELYKAVLDFYENDDRNDVEFKEDFPNLFAIVNSPTDKLQRYKAFSDSLKNPALLKELGDIDNIAEKFDLTEYEFGADKNAKPLEGKNGSDGKSAWDNESMENVDVWYKSAKKILDPDNRLGDTELYDVFNDRTLQGLQDARGGDYWFTELLDGMGYPDTPEGIEALTNDLTTVLTRKKNAGAAKKYGAALTPLKFLFDNTFQKLEDGRAPNIYDVGIDMLTNVGWAVPGGTILKGLQAVKLAPKAAKTTGVLGNALGKIEANSVVPVASNAAEAVNEHFAENSTSAARNGGFWGSRLGQAVIGTGINNFTPNVIKMGAQRVMPFLGLEGKAAGKALTWLDTFINHGTTRNKAASEYVEKVLEDQAKRDAAVFARKFSLDGVRNPELANVLLNETKPGYISQNVENIARTLFNDKENDGKAAIAQWLRSNVNDAGEKAVLRHSYRQAKTMADHVLPWLSSYLVNRGGTQSIGDWIRQRVGRSTRFWGDEEE